MIIILTALSLFYLLYMLILVVPDVNSLVIIVTYGVIYIVYFCSVVKRPEYSLYAFMAIYLLFPKAGNAFVVVSIVESPPITMSMMLTNIAALGICLRVLRGRMSKTTTPKKLHNFFLLICITIIILFTLAIGRQFFGPYWDVSVRAEELGYVLPLLHGAIFLYGCMVFISTVKQLEQMFLILLLPLIEITIESILFFYLGIPDPFNYRILYPIGNYKSLIFGGYQILTYVTLVSVSCFLYFVFSRKNFKLLFIVPAFFLPILASFRRSSIIAETITVASYFFLISYKSRKFLVMLTALIVLVCFLNIKGSAIIDSVASVWEGTTRKGYFNTYYKSWVARIGAYSRGLDVFIFSFPVGVGPGRLYPFMNASFVPCYLGASQSSIDRALALGDLYDADMGEARNFYYKIAENQHTTSPHNSIVGLIAEYGLLGVLILWFFMFYLLQNFYEFIKKIRVAKRQMQSYILVQITSYSAIFGIFIYMFTEFRLVFWILFFLLFLSFFPIKYDMR